MTRAARTSCSPGGGGGGIITVHNPEMKTAKGEGTMIAGLGSLLPGSTELVLKDSTGRTDAQAGMIVDGRPVQTRVYGMNGAGEPSFRLGKRMSAWSMLELRGPEGLVVFER